MKLSTLLIIFSVGIIIYSSIGLKKSYFYYKNEPGYNSISIFYSKAAGIVVGVLFLILYFLGYIDVE